MQRLDDLFDLRYGQSLELNALKQVAPPRGVNFVSRAMRNNGVTARVSTTADPGPTGAITVALGGNGVLSSFVQPEPFVCGRDVMILTPKDPTMSLAEKLWWCRCIWQNKYRFSYGRQANRTLGSLIVPSEVPNWVHETPIPSLAWADVSNFGLVTGIYPGSYDDLVPITAHFDIEYGHALSLSRLVQVEAPRGVNFVSRKTKDNGIASRVLIPEGITPAPAQTLSVALGATPLATFFHSEPYLTGYHVAVLRPKTEMSVGELLWWKIAIEANKYRYSYGRQANRTLSSLLVPAAPPAFVSDILKDRDGVAASVA
ncbi:hypothetical protein AOZ07_11560 [Glutamicibacter halophytocola]|uniref:hypothetical protein n=1 Tax=Glutamicibacter halophytocola TaxID=1933880 RepID=UPI0006D4B7C0|nr:hypothetical protein [Glutamicibacter halophytocola]ALG29553.1 hypothetical protein AOZ07_11560 [Glutamicibacter halophytocola]